MKIQIGLRHGGGQLSFEIDWNTEELLRQIETARENNGVLNFTDVKGDRALIPADSIGYVLVPAEKEHRVGFGRPQ